MPRRRPIAPNARHAPRTLCGALALSALAAVPGACAPGAAGNGLQATGDLRPLSATASEESWTETRDAWRTRRSARRDACARPEPSRFSFHNDMWLNLHNFLYREAKRLEGVEDEGVLAGGNVVDPGRGVRALTAKEAAVWDRALRFYREFVVEHRLGQVVRDNDRLATAREPDLSDVELDPRQRQILSLAAPVYQEVWWPAHQRANQRWIASMGRLLEATEGCLAGRLAELFWADWHPTPIPVHATVYASWYGAYTTTETPRITMSSTAVGNQGAHGLEGLFHEAGHTLMGLLEERLEEMARGTPVNRRELGHLILFYTAGEIVREALPRHTPVAEAFGIWEQNRNARRYRRVLEKRWTPYLAGERTLDETLERVTDALGAR